MNTALDLNSQLPTFILLAIFMLLGLFGLWLTLRGLKHCCKLRPLKGCSLTCCGALLCAISLLVIATVINIASYARLTHEQPIADLHFNQLAPQKYRVEVTFLEENRQQEFDIIGDEWQLDAKVLKWHGYANLMGFNAQYKLHRLAGRYSTLEQTNSQPASAYDLNADPGLDVWHFARRYPQLLPLIDAHYGSAVFLPMADKAEFKVYMTQNGLIARPMNNYSEQRLRSW